MTQITTQRELSRKSSLSKNVDRLIRDRPTWRTCSVSSTEAPPADEVLSRPVELLEDLWGQPPAEDYSVERVEKPFTGPALRTRREHKVYDAIQATGSRHWLERAPEGGIHVCVRSRLSGSVYRYQFGHRAAS